MHIASPKPQRPDGIGRRTLTARSEAAVLRCGRHKPVGSSPSLTLHLVQPRAPRRREPMHPCVARCASATGGSESLTSRYTEHSPTHNTQHTAIVKQKTVRQAADAGRDAATRHFDVPRAGAQPVRLPRLPWPCSANCFLFPSCAVLRRVASPVLFPREDIIRQGRVAQQRSSE